jgi:hypothetical protein
MSVQEYIFLLLLFQKVSGKCLENLKVTEKQNDSLTLAWDYTCDQCSQCISDRVNGTTFKVYWEHKKWLACDENNKYVSYLFYLILFQFVCQSLQSLSPSFCLSVWSISKLYPLVNLFVTCAVTPSVGPSISQLVFQSVYCLFQSVYVTTVQLLMFVIFCSACHFIACSICLSICVS